MKERNQSGQFVAKGEEIRQVRSLRLTDSTWDTLGEVAEERGMTRADLLEQLVENEALGEADQEQETAVNEETLEEAVEILKEALTMKANAGGAIKAQIRKALELLGVDLDD